MGATVLRLSGMRFVVFTNDHVPAHMHVFGEGTAKINLRGADGRAELV